MTWIGTAGCLLATFRRRARRLLLLPNQIAEAEILTARLLIGQLRTSGPLEDIRKVEFKVFSQFGDDGIIQYLVHRARIREAERSFVEFGVENYEKSNTRFLLVNDNWQRLVMDGDPRNIRYIRNDPLY